MAPAADPRPDPGRIEELFHEAVQLPPAEQPEFVAGAANGDSRLQQAVCALLAAGREPDTAWDHNALELEARRWAFDSRAAPPSEFFGPYRVVRRIASGGMGSVYEALRDDAEFHKRVAIKFAHQEQDDPAIASRFRSERQILAELEHPSIARLLDGGTTADGIAYLVMEYVDGVPIDRYAVEHNLSRAARLQLWLRVSEAVQYAHRNLVVHRDLKPGNILVTSDGVPKLLDFGIAKLLGSESDATTIRALTPEYASPEQVAGRAISTGSDIYSLGVLLFLLMAGRLPYRPTAAQPVELVRAICEDEPVWEPHGLLDSDLFSILAQALHKEPERRYLSVESFAEDVRRYLAGLPVSARADSMFYRARKFAVRRAIPLAAAAALTVAILVGLSTSLWQARRAERQRLIAQRRFDQVRQLAYSIIHEIQPKLAAINGTVALRMMLIERTMSYLEALARDAADSPPLMRELLDSYVELAKVAADAGTSNVGDVHAAAEILQKAEVLATLLAHLDGATPASARSLIRFYNAAARNATYYGSWRGAESHARQALVIAERLAGSMPQDLQAQNELASSALTLADVTTDLTEDSDLHHQTRAELYQRSLAIWREASRREPASDTWKKNMALALKNLAGVWQANDVPRSLDAAMQARDIDQEFLNRNPSSPVALMDLAFDIGAVGRAFYLLGDYSKAATTMRENVAVREKVVAANPDDRRAADRLAYALRDLAQTEMQLRQPRAARRDLQRTAQLYSRLSERGPLNPQSLFRFAETAQDLARADGNASSPEVCRWVLKSLALLDEYDKRHPVPTGRAGEFAVMRSQAASCRP